MTGKTNKALSSVLPLDARVARIAAGGGFVASLQDSPVGRAGARNRACGAAGFEPDGLDCAAPHAAESRKASSLAVPCPSVQSEPIRNDNPT